MPLRFSDDVKKKLAEKHGVSEDEVRQCFENLEGEYVKETRIEHLTDPPHWFVAETNKRRLLKVVFVARRIKTESGTEIRVDIKTAFPPDSVDIDLYRRLGM